ncbi:trypsin-like serine protease [Streptomyces sp. NPDC017868]|uniref:trypsin-like serine protease n=1 Tax=Streptomyces sp. NPDC017868 TaxID=3365014 RepID=UPI003793729E
MNSWTSTARTPRLRTAGHTSTDAYPCQVSLQQYKNGAWNHICGRSIIGEQWVLTAAHCLTEQSVSRLPRFRHADASTATVAAPQGRHPEKSYMARLQPWRTPARGPAGPLSGIRVTWACRSTLVQTCCPNMRKRETVNRTRARRNRSAQAKCLVRSILPRPAVVGRVGLEPTADGL